MTDPRAALRETAEDAVDALKEFYMNALKAEKELKPKCAKCGHWQVVVVPDWSSRLRAVEGLLEQGYGRPVAATETARPTVKALSDLEAMTDEQLAAIAESG